MVTGMVLCRGCGKEIQSTESSCPQCGALQHNRTRTVTYAILGAVFILTIIGILAAIIVPKIAQTREEDYVKIIRSDLSMAATAQELYILKADSYKSCAPCTSKNLPGYNNSPKVTLVTKVWGEQGLEFLLLATHEYCGSSKWTYQSYTETITEPSDGCKY